MDCTLKVERVDGKTLRISGTCLAPAPHYLLKLEADNPGVVPNPGRVVLALRETPPQSRVPQVLTETPVYYVEPLGVQEVEVEIRGAKPTLHQIE